jgi:hypothetical protein
MNGYVAVQTVASDRSVAVCADELRELVRLAEANGWRPREAGRVLWCPCAEEAGTVSPLDALTLVAALEGAQVGFRLAAEADPGRADDWEEFVRQMVVIAASGPFGVVVEMF